MRLAFHLYREWWKKWRTLPVRSWIRAAQYYREGKLAEAEEQYKLGLKRHARHPARACAHLDLSHCLFKARKLVEAEFHLRAALRINPLSREAVLRLARLQLWTGHVMEATWTIRRALEKLPVDPELAGLYLTAALETGADYLVEEAASHAARVDVANSSYPRFETALSLLAIHRGDTEHGRKELCRLASMEKGPFEAVVAFADLLLKEDKTAYARHHLHRALAVASEHPRVLSSLAFSYLRPGEFYQPEFAVQLALKACQSTNWLSPRAMHTLAESYYHAGDRMSALLVASRAKTEGSRLLGVYPESKILDDLIETLSEPTAASTPEI